MAAMIANDLILAITQSAGGTRASVFDSQGRRQAETFIPLARIYPAPGRVELDPEDIWRDVLTVWRRALEMTKADDVAALTLATQADSFVLWDRETGRPLANAIAATDRRGTERLAALVAQGSGSLIEVRTGLNVETTSPAANLSVLLDEIEGARDKASTGALAFGTLDCFLLWRLSGRQRFRTEPSNAARTMLYNIHMGRWDADLLDLFGIPDALLPEVRDSADKLGETDKEIYGRPIPIVGMLCDRQAALIGHGCTDRDHMTLCLGDMGGEAALLANTGGSAIGSRNGLSATVAWRTRQETVFALEAGPYDAGSALRWLRDELRLVEDPRTFETLAKGLKSNGGVYMVPAFSGLGPPRRDPHARAAIYGLGPTSGPAELARAALESLCYQAHDMLAAMVSDG
ncbi:MAG: FGGY family carbohydrate kinase, partial [Rhodospirillaceae bacterium]